MASMCEVDGLDFEHFDYGPLTQMEFDKKYKYRRSDPGTCCKGVDVHCLKSTLKRQLDGFSLRRFIRRRLPIMQWISQYSLKNDLLSDVIAGLTLGIYNIPQGMAYSVLATLPPVYGLYASFFPPLIYLFFGSSKHISIGVFSITCLMVGTARMSIIPDLTIPANVTVSYQGIDGLTPVSVAIALSFIVGVLQLMMALLRLDFLAVYLSDHVVAGFTMGAAAQAVVSQLAKVFGIEAMPKREGFFKMFRTLADIVRLIPQGNIAVMLISMASVLFLLFGKYVIDPKVKRFLILPIPYELFLLVAGTAVSYMADFKGSYGIPIVGAIPTGLPAPLVPRFELMPFLFSHGLGIAIVAYAITLSMGKLFARKHHYLIDPSQELYALGFCSLISSFFSAFPTSTSLSRSLVNEAAGTKTQITAVFSSAVLLVVIMWIGPLMQTLPYCILSSIVIVAHRTLFAKVFTLHRLWRFSKVDFAIFVFSCLATVSYDLVEGLAASVLFAMLTVVLRSQWPVSHRLGRLPDRNEYRKMDSYGSARDISHIPILRFDSPLLFTNVDSFKSAVHKQAAMLMNKASKKFSKVLDDFQRTIQTDDRPEHVALDNVEMARQMDVELHDHIKTGLSILRRAPEMQWMLIDCSTWTYTDSMGVDAIKQICGEMLERNILLLFANVKAVPEDSFFPTIHDAILAARKSKKSPSSIGIGTPNGKNANV